MSAFGGSELGTSVKQITSEDAFLHGVGIWTSYRPSTLLYLGGTPIGLRN